MKRPAIIVAVAHLCALSWTVLMLAACPSASPVVEVRVDPADAHADDPTDDGAEATESDVDQPPPETPPAEPPPSPDPGGDDSTDNTDDVDDTGDDTGDQTPAPCVVGGLYCGGDRVSGDPDTLYRCTDAAPALVEVCAAGCVVAPVGQDDHCAATTAGNDCVVGGFYCGGDRVTGDANTLYECRGPGVPDVAERCAAGCVVAPAGQDDYCAATTAGNDCVVGGFYCGGDRVTGDPNTLYRCEGRGTPTVIERCAQGCSVNAGVDDSCVGTRVSSPVPGYGVTYPYGVRNPRYAAGYHTGDDYAVPTGTSAVAVRSGVIRWSNDNGGAYGKWIGLDADNGRTYVYCHLSTRLVSPGTRVSAGQVIARTGATGNVTGPHLHFEDHPQGNFVYAQCREPRW